MRGHLRYTFDNDCGAAAAIILCESESAIMSNTFLKTPPMGWNSWDCYGASVREDEVLAHARFMADNLKAHGWEYVTVDIEWSEPGAQGTEYRNLPKLCMDKYGRQMPAENRFPSAKGGAGFKPLADAVHAMGLKFGIHILRGIPRQAIYADCPVLGTEYTARDVAVGDNVCPWNMDMYGLNTKHPGAQAYYDSIFRLYAEWGVDLVKVDDMSHMQYFWKEDDYYEDEARIIRNAIDKCGRNIVFSSSPGMYSLNAARTVSECTNMWRISNDFWDSWKALDEQFDLLTKWLPYMSEGHYPDADMIPVGRLSVRSNSEWNKPRMTNFTQNEQYFLMSLWCIARSPLILGCDMPGMDDFTRSLLTNDYALDVNQHSNGTRMIFRRGGIGAWACDTQEGACVGLFNLENETRAASITLPEAGLTGKFDATDAWKERHIMNDGEMLCVKLGAHEGTLIRLKRE